jgi:hypothetical protein
MVAAGESPPSHATALAINGTAIGIQADRHHRSQEGTPSDTSLHAVFSQAAVLGCKQVVNRIRMATPLKSNYSLEIGFSFRIGSCLKMLN